MFSFLGLKSADIWTHWVVEIGGETLVLIVRIFTSGAPFDCGRPPVPRAKAAANPGWTSWRGHDIVVNPIELYTRPRVLGVAVSCALYMSRWQGKYDYTLSNDLVADQKRYREGVEEGGEK